MLYKINKNIVMLKINNNNNKFIIKQKNVINTHCIIN